jgi:3-deoxy-7-phosphoheptulonate synthase
MSFQTSGSHPELLNIHVRDVAPLIPPSQIRTEFPMSDSAAKVVSGARTDIQNILDGKDDRLLVIVGPCSIHARDVALDYAERLARLREEVSDKLMIVMRVYFEKPRTTVGWKGLIPDPHLDDSFAMQDGLRLGRQILVEINEMGVAAGTEFLDPIVPQYIAGLISWAAIGARTTESQTHRQMASGLSMPVGFKNSTDGEIQNAINAMVSAQSEHSFLGINDEGRSSVIHTAGNPWCHCVLRGGSDQPNYESQFLTAAAEKLTAAGLPPALMVDCSHANSGKKHEQQSVVWESILKHRRAGDRTIFGTMLESNINPGRQILPAGSAKLEYGVSITDECIGWDRTEELLRQAAEV